MLGSSQDNIVMSHFRIVKCVPQFSIESLFYSFFHSESEILALFLDVKSTSLPYWSFETVASFLVSMYVKFNLSVYKVSCI